MAVINTLRNRSIIACENLSLLFPALLPKSSDHPVIAQVKNIAGRRLIKFFSVIKNRYLFIEFGISST